MDWLAQLLGGQSAGALGQPQMSAPGMVPGPQTAADIAQPLTPQEPASWDTTSRPANWWERMSEKEQSAFAKGIGGGLGAFGSAMQPSQPALRAPAPPMPPAPAPMGAFAPFRLK